LLVCGQCGSKMHRRTRKGFSASYLCPNTRGAGVNPGLDKCSGVAISETVAEKLLVDAFKSAVAEPHKRHVSRAKVLRPKSKSSGTDVADLYRRLETAAALASRAPNVPARRAYERQVKELGDEIVKAELQSAADAANTAEASRTREDAQELRRQIRDLDGVWARATVAQRRQILSLAVKSASPVGQRSSRRNKSLEIVWQTCDSCGEELFGGCSC
jgi:hypothetical protein